MFLNDCSNTYLMNPRREDLGNYECYPEGKGTHCKRVPSSRTRDYNYAVFTSREERYFMIPLNR